MKLNLFKALWHLCTCIRSHNPSTAACCGCSSGARRRELVQQAPFLVVSLILVEFWPESRIRSNGALAPFYSRSRVLRIRRTRPFAFYGVFAELIGTNCFAWINQICVHRQLSYQSTHSTEINRIFISLFLFQTLFSIYEVLYPRWNCEILRGDFF